ncbi:hypothetical protein ACPZ19_48335 [Amycolatopsis lurida]
MDTMTRPAPGLRVDVPPGFAGIPITGGPEAIAAAVRRMAQRIGTAAPEQSGDIEENLGGLAHFLAQREVRLFGRFAVTGDDTREPALANLALAIVDFGESPEGVGAGGANRVVAAATLVKQYRDRHPDADVQVVELAGGPAMVAQRAGYHQVGDTRRVPEFKAEFQLPSPDTRRLAVMVVSTGEEAAWPAVAAAAMRSAHSIRFEEPDSDQAANR